MIGETVGNFRVIGRLGKGGMGEVWLGEHVQIKTKVAIKILSADISADKQQVQRFFNEAVAVGKIKHAGIVRIFDVGFHAGSPGGSLAFLIMELLEGEVLSARVKRVGPMPLPELADIARQIAGVLEATHAEGITHRDLKPDNVFLIKDAELASGERVKVLDFGIAKLGEATNMTATSAGSMGTPSYMSPEQWKASGKVDHRADAYSLGCLIFELACGRPPFLATSIGQACDMHLHEQPPSARALAPALPESIDALLARLLAKQPERRPTMQEVKAAFAGFPDAKPGALDATMAPTARSPTPASDDRSSDRSDGAPAIAKADPAATQPASARAKRGTDAEPIPTAVLPEVSLPPDTTLGGSAAVVATREVPPRSRRGLVIAIGGVAAAGAVIAYLALREPAARPSTPARAGNRFVRIEPAKGPLVLGVPADAADTTRGFRPTRNVLAPTTAYAIQSHEVTWGEIDPWLVANPTLAPAALPGWAKDLAVRAQLPVTGMTWSAALAYCKSLGGTLPTEEQWEYAARGAELRPNPWGSQRSDLMRTRAFAGLAATPAPVGWSDQDVTPDGALHDFAGNVQEWTLDLWRPDEPGHDESWVQNHATLTTFRAIRGLPLAGVPRAPVPGMKSANASACYREHLCATGTCADDATKKLAYVGFRCVRAEP